jgi:hypothetical protein
MLHQLLILIAVFVTTQNGILAAAPDEGTITRISRDQGLPTRFPRFLALAPGQSLWVAFMAEQGVGRGEGLVKIDGLTIKPYHGPSAGLSSDPITSLAVLPGGRIAATDARGLHLLESDDRFHQVGPAFPWSQLNLSAGGVLWLAGTDSDVRLRIGHLAVGGNSRIEEFALPGRHRLLRLLPESDSSAFIVCEDSLYRIHNGKCVPVDLHKSPLWRKPVHDPDGPIPSIWLYDALFTGNGNLCLIGHSKCIARLSSQSADSHWEKLADGHFARLTPGDKPDSFFVSDFSGGLHRWDDRGLRPVYQVNSGSIGTVMLDRRGTLWVESQPRNDSHEIICFRPPYDSPPAVRFSLGHDSYLSPGILAMIEDDLGGAWISTNEGLWHLRF